MHFMGLSTATKCFSCKNYSYNAWIEAWPWNIFCKICFFSRIWQNPEIFTPCQNFRLYSICSPNSIITASPGIFLGIFQMGGGEFDWKCMRPRACSSVLQCCRTCCENYQIFYYKFLKGEDSHEGGGEDPPLTLCRNNSASIKSM